MNCSSGGFLKDVPDAWGPKIATQAGAVTLTRTGPNEINFSAPVHMALILLTPQRDRVRSLNSDPKSVFTAQTGSVEIIPATAEMYAGWKVAKENLLFALAPETLRTLAGLEFGGDGFEFHATAKGRVDRKAFMLASFIQGELQQGAAHNELYIDSLITVFATHLLREYTTLSDLPVPHHRGGLPPKIWRDVENYIHTYLERPLSVEQLAKVADLSPSHFLRAFRETTGMPPHKFVLVKRLEAAERLLLTTDMPLAQVSALTGFSNHSHMTATMKRFRATTPSAIRRGRPAE